MESWAKLNPSINAYILYNVCYLHTGLNTWSQRWMCVSEIVLDLAFLALCGAYVEIPLPSSTCRPSLLSPNSLLHCPAVWSGQCDPHSAVAAPTVWWWAPVNYTITISPGLSPVTTSGTIVPVTVSYNVRHTVSIVATNCNGSSSATMATIRIGNVVVK